MHRRKLPIGIQTFREIREGDYYYVDKTGLVDEYDNPILNNLTNQDTARTMRD